jgi:hypothetical protein
MDKAKKQSSPKRQPRQKPAAEITGISPDLQAFIDTHAALPRGNWPVACEIRNRHANESAVYKNVDAVWSTYTKSLQDAALTVMKFPARDAADLAVKLDFLRRTNPALDAFPVFAAGIRGVIADAARLAKPKAVAADEKLLALARDAETAHEIHQVLWRRFVALKEAAENDPACPTGAPPYVNQAAYDAERHFVNQRTGTLYDEAADASTKLAKLARELFALKARTAQGVLAKLRFLVSLKGSPDDCGDDLETYQRDDDWLADTLADFERVVKGGAA